MRVDLRILKPNPLRDLAVDPILDDPKILISIQKHSFWGGCVIWRAPNGDLYIIAGHVRVRMAIQAGITHADLFVTDNLTDDEIVVIYARENATQRGNTSPAVAGSVAATIRLILRNQFNGNGAAGDFTSSAGSARDGIGRDTILSVLDGTPGYTDNVVKQQIAILKSSGDYDRIINEEITKARERLRAEEEARQRAEAARIEAEARAAAARDAEERRQAEAEASAAAAEEAEHAAAVATGQGNVDRAQEATDHAAERRTEQYGSPDPFDFTGVSRWLTTPAHVEFFRTMVLGEGLRLILDRDQQAPLAQSLVEQARNGNAELTVAFIHDHLNALVLANGTEQGRITRAEERRLLRADWQARVERQQRQFSRQCQGMVSAAAALEELNQHRPRGVTLHTTGEFRNAVEAAKRAVALLEEKGII